MAEAERLLAWQAGKSRAIERHELRERIARAPLLLSVRA
jgi:hypothetical protein